MADSGTVFILPLSSVYDKLYSSLASPERLLIVVSSLKNRLLSEKEAHWKSYEYGGRCATRRGNRTRTTHFVAVYIAW